MVKRPNIHSSGDSDVTREALLADPALAEALADPAGFERLSDIDVRTMRMRRRRVLGAAGAAMLLVVGAGSRWATAPLFFIEKTEHYATARGHRADVQLADGSSLTLDGATTVDVTLGTNRRTVVMQAGEAYFDVAHDPARPFTVQAGASSASVLGTAFDLNLMHGKVDLAVYRGAVRFGATNAGTPGTVVRAGWRSRFIDGLASEPSPFDINRQDWRDGWLDADDMPLDELVEAINRHGGTIILPPPEQLAKVRIAGRFRLDNPTMLLDAIGGAYGFRVRHDAHGLHLDPVTAS